MNVRERCNLRTHPAQGVPHSALDEQEDLPAIEGAIGPVGGRGGAASGAREEARRAAVFRRVGQPEDARLPRVKLQPRQA